MIKFTGGLFIIACRTYAIPSSVRPMPHEVYDLFIKVVVNGLSYHLQSHKSLQLWVDAIWDTYPEENLKTLTPASWFRPTYQDRGWSHSHSKARLHAGFLKNIDDKMEQFPFLSKAGSRWEASPQHQLAECALLQTARHHKTSPRY